MFAKKLVEHLSLGRNDRRADRFQKIIISPGTLDHGAMSSARVDQRLPPAAHDDGCTRAAQPQPSLHLSPMLDIASMKVRQRSKIEEIRTALLRAGTLTLDKQAEVLGLSRSTTWSILRATHKNSGLSAGVINRILSSPRLPALARQRIFEYIQERMAGLYGHSARRRREFAASLAIAQSDETPSELKNPPLAS